MLKTNLNRLQFNWLMSIIRSDDRREFGICDWRFDVACALLTSFTEPELSERIEEFFDKPLHGFHFDMLRERKARKEKFNDFTFLELINSYVLDPDLPYDETVRAIEAEAPHVNDFIEEVWASTKTKKIVREILEKHIGVIVI